MTHGGHRRRRALGFDSWTRGAHHFERLVPAFDARGMDLSLLHLGSWGNDPGRPREEMLGKLPVRDVSGYGRLTFSEILDLEKPDAAIFLSTETFAHRAFNRLCQQRGIPTVNLYHGLVGTYFSNDRDENFSSNSWAWYGIVAKKLGKIAVHTLPCYVHALRHTGAGPDEWGRFASDVWRLATGRLGFAAAEDARTNKCCVYTAADVNHAVTKYGFQPVDVIPVGNPDLVDFGVTSGMIGTHVGAPPRDGRSVMYVETGLVASGLFVNNEAQYIGHLQHTQEKLLEQGRSLLFKSKPHASEGSSATLRALASAGVEVIDNRSFVPRLVECCACIVEYTSLALVPALMGMPLFLANYGMLADMRFGDVLRSYPRSHALGNVADFSAVLEADRKACDRRLVMDWIVANRGPFPAEEMPNRVAEVVGSLIERGAGPSVARA